MKHFFFAFLLMSLTLSFAQQAERQNVAVTVYNSNLGVIKDVRTFELEKGKQEIKLTDVAEQIDPTSVMINFDGEVIEQNYQYDLVNFFKILSRYTDRNIELIHKDGTLISGELLSGFGGQLVIRNNDGGLTMIPSIDEYRIAVGELPEGLITKPTLVWTVNSNVSGSEDIEVTYQTSGLNWHAEYVALLNEDDTELDLSAWVSIDNNSGATYKDAKLKLVAGDVNRVREAAGAPRYEVEDAMVKSQQRQFVEETFFEYHIYNLERPATLANNETKQISLFEAKNIKAEKKYFYGQANYYRSNSKPGRVNVIVEFENSEEFNLGVPMPKGKIRVNKGYGGNVEFVGEDLIDHTPKGEKIRLTLGEAFDIVVEEKQTESRRISDKVNEQEYELTFRNHKEEDVTIDVVRNLGYNWEILSSSHEYEKADARSVKFSIPVKSDGTTKLTYRVRYSY